MRYSAPSEEKQEIDQEPRGERSAESGALAFQPFLEKLPAAAYICDAEGLITYFNQHALQLWGRAPKVNDPADRFCGSFKLFSPDGSAISHEQCWMALALQTGMEYNGCEIIIERQDGERIAALAHANPIHDESGRLVGAINVLVDITERKRAEETSALLAAVVDSSDDAIVAKTLDGTITAWNRGAERIFGYTASEAIGQHISLIIPPELKGEEDNVIARLRRGEKVDHFETVRQAKDGRKIDISLTVSPVRNTKGQIIGASKVARDITERKRQEELLKEADRHKNEFLAALSHELRTPLSAILGWVMITRKRADLATTTRALEIIERNAKHQLQLIEELLDMSRIAAGTLRLDLSPVHLPHVVVAAIDSLRVTAEVKSVELDLRIDREVPLLVGDEQRLYQVICNLLGNAIKFTPAGGRVVVEVLPTTATVEVRVSDTGKGIPAEFLPYVFEAFRQGKGSLSRSGLGLGLTIVRRLVELHGGTVHAHSDGEGKGAVFTVRLPLASDQVANHS